MSSADAKFWKFAEEHGVKRTEASSDSGGDVKPNPQVSLLDNRLLKSRAEMCA